MSQIWITGIGIVSPLGIGREAVAESLALGRRAIGPIETFDSTGFTVGEAGEVKGLQPRQIVKNRKALKVSRRNTHLALVAGCLAWEDAGLAGRVAEERAGIVMSAGRITADLNEVTPLVRASLDEDGQLNLESYARNCPSFFPPYWFLRHIPNMVPAHLSIELRLKGPSDTTCMTVVGGLVALETASQILRRGDADVMLAGASDTLVEPYHLITHLQTGRLDTRSGLGPRPFESDAQGTVLGEGSTVLVLERADFAERTGATPLAVLREFESGWFFETRKDRPPQLVQASSFRNPSKAAALGGTGLSTFDAAEIALASEAQSLVCYRSLSGWLGSTNGPHDLACLLLQAQTGKVGFPRLGSPSWVGQSGQSGEPVQVGSGDLLSAQSLSYAGQFAKISFQLP